MTVWVIIIAIAGHIFVSGETWQTQEDCGREAARITASLIEADCLSVERK